MVIINFYMRIILNFYEIYMNLYKLILWILNLYEKRARARTSQVCHWHVSSREATKLLSSSWLRFLSVFFNFLLYFYFYNIFIFSIALYQHLPNMAIPFLKLKRIFEYEFHCILF